MNQHLKDVCWDIRNTLIGFFSCFADLASQYNLSNNQLNAQNIVL